MLAKCFASYHSDRRHQRYFDQRLLDLQAELISHPLCPVHLVLHFSTKLAENVLSNGIVSGVASKYT